MLRNGISWVDPVLRTYFRVAAAYTKAVAGKDSLQAYGNSLK
jgi:hypothetical protein